MTRPTLVLSLGTYLQGAPLDAVKSLVLNAGVALFYGKNDIRKGDIWVVRDEILHCVQNDKGGPGAAVALWGGCGFRGE
jgi:hypothetical protein